MTKKFIAAVLTLVMIFTFTSCSAAENVAGWFEGITEGASGIIPNDVEMIIGQMTGQEQETEPHEIIYSQGYVAMLESRTFCIVYHLSDGTEVIYGSNGVRSGSSYPEPAEAKDDGTIPNEHIVLYEGIYYYIDDNSKKMYTVNPDNYKAVPFEISADGIAFSGSGTADFEGSSCRFERYTTDSGDITFYYNNAVLKGMKIEQGSAHTLSDITSFTKYLSTTLVAMPASYIVVNYWTAS